MATIPFRDLPDAGLWRRLAALGYDALLIGAIWFVCLFVAAILQGGGQPVTPEAAPVPIVPPELGPFITLPFLWATAAGFYALFWRRGGQTLGMKTWRLKLVTPDGRPPTARAILLRCTVGTASLSACLLGFLWVVVDGRTWHDRASGTRIVVLPD